MPQAKQGGAIATTVSCRLEKLIEKAEDCYTDSWMQGETITEMKGRLGKDLEGVENGDIIVQENTEGRLMVSRGHKHC